MHQRFIYQSQIKWSLSITAQTTWYFRNKLTNRMVLQNWTDLSIYSSNDWRPIYLHLNGIWNENISQNTTQVCRVNVSFQFQEIRKFFSSIFIGNAKTFCLIINSDSLSLKRKYTVLNYWYKQSNSVIYVKQLAFSKISTRSGSHSRLMKTEMLQMKMSERNTQSIITKRVCMCIMLENV